jgi:hypothetical protein
MSDPMNLTDEFIYRIAPDGASVKAALELLRRGAFRSPRFSADGIRLQAGCQGSEPRPYAVEVELSDPQRPRTGCNCGSYKRPCKHALGLLLLAARSPGSFERAAVSAPKTGASKRGRAKAALLGATARQEAASEEKPPAEPFRRAGRARMSTVRDGEDGRPGLENQSQKSCLRALSEYRAAVQGQGLFPSPFFRWSRKEAAITWEEQLDGIYVIRTSEKKSFFRG